MKPGFYVALQRADGSDLGSRSAQEHFSSERGPNSDQESETESSYLVIYQVLDEQKVQARELESARIFGSDVIGDFNWHEYQTTLSLADAV